MAISNAIRDNLAMAFVYAITVLLAWQIGIFIYRRYLSPLATVPGPFLASFSDIYYFYHQFIKEGTLYLQYERLKEQYGMCKFL